jgi:hypothetical protein
MRAKLERADEHFKALVAECGSYFDGDPHSYKTDADLSAGTYGVRVMIESPPPIRLAIICGDFIQNLRAALDHLANALVSQPTRQTQFPIYSAEDDFKERVVVPAQRARTGPLSGLDVNSDVFKKIAGYQPFNLSAHQAKLENHPLYQLAELSNEDKHRTILTRAACHRAEMDQPSPEVEFGGVDIECVGQATYVYDKPLGTGDVFLTGTFKVTGPNPQVLISGSLLTDLAFGGDLTTTDGLEAIRRAVWGICNTLPTV